ncbi:MAG: fibronectin type III domain-containing protein [Tepidisphaeraceae bacterium]
MSSRSSNSKSLRSAVKSVVEQLEKRFMMDATGFSAFVNFQPAAAPVHPGYLVDGGATYGDRGNGFTYGWDADNTAATRDRDNVASPDQRYDTFIHTQLGGTFSWELAVPDGLFQVKVVSGDANFFNSVYKFNVENVEAINATPTTGNRWAENTVQVIVTDGKLTLTNGDGAVNNKIAFIEITGLDAPAPSVVVTRPANGETNVSRDIFVAADLDLPNAGIDPDTLTTNTVFLRRTSDQQLVPAVVNTSGGGDTIVLQPSSVLAANTNYTFTVTAGLLDLAGEAFTPFTMNFTTGTAGAEVDPTLNFDKLPQATSAGNAYTSLTKGPDGKLYASTLDGRILRFAINADGSLGAGETISSLQTAEGGSRVLTGIEFDPSSTAGNLILWVSHGFFDFENAPDWSGKISKLTGPDLGTVQDVVVGLPRSIRDHLNNQMDFGPDGKLYFLQGSNTAMGAPDTAWGMRPERILNGAVLRLDTSLLTPGVPLDVKTEEGGAYDPFAAGAPLTLYAVGVRNAYDLVWTQNGRLYVPTNGSASGGSTPGFPNATTGQRLDDPLHGPYTGPNVPSIGSVNATQNDYLFRIEQGGYYGHPNPRHGTYVLNGGNPTAGVDPGEVTQYPVGTLPDVNWRGSAFNFGKNLSPNGVIEYQGNAFGGALNGKLLVVRYSGGDDVIVLTPDANGNIIQSQTNVNGMSGFYNPLDIAQDTATGNIYVAEFGPEGAGTPGGQRITLLKPAAVGQAEYASDDVGSPNPPGTTTVVTEGSEYDITSAGAGITGTSDQFRFLHKQVTGDFDHMMRINSLTEPDADSAAGLMARESLATGSRNVFMKARPSTGGYRFSYRTATNGSTTAAGSGAVTYPNVWVRLRRVGNVFTGFRSTDGVNWTQVSQVTQNSMPATVFLGAAVSAKTTNGATTTAQLRNLGPTFALASPTNLAATPASSTQVDLTWTDNSAGETGFIIQRKTGAGGTYAAIHTTAANATSYSDTTAVAGTQYFYRIAADGNPDSTFSNEDEATTPSGSLAAPSNLVATGASSAQVNLAWADNSTSETGFEIQRKTGAGGTYVTIFTTAANATSYSDTDPTLTADTQYFYRVRAVNGGVQSPFSNEDDGTTLPSTGVPAYQQDPGADGLVVFEAEGNDGIVNQGGKTWSANSTAGFTGTGALQATPNTGVNNNTGYVTTSPRIDFAINFTKTGVHHVWIRGLAPTGSDDTVHVGLDGAAVATSDRMNGFTPEGSYVWSNGTIDAVVATINVTTLGIHTLNVWMREDGFIIDKLLLTTNAAFVPTGNGPNVSPRTGPSQTPAAASNVNATAAAPTQVDLTWSDNSGNETGFKVMRKTGAGGTYAPIFTTAANATSYSDTTALANTTYFYKVVATNTFGDAPDSNEDSVTTPVAGGGSGTPAVNQTQIEFNDPNDATPSPSQTLVLTNTGATPLVIPANGVTIVGTDAARFQITSNHSTQVTLNQNESLNIVVTYTANGVDNIHDATLRITNGSATPQVDVRLRGLGTQGNSGENEPSLQKILDTYRIPINVGDSDVSNPAIPFPPVGPNDEVDAAIFQKAGAGNVTIEPLAAFASTFPTLLRFGHYTPGVTSAKTELFTVAGADAQTLNPIPIGTTSFDPGAATFGLYSIWPEFADREVFSEDQFNTWDPNVAQRTKVRFWTLKNPDGSVVPNAYVFGFEEATNHDLQDFAGIIRNVIIPAVATPAFQQGSGPDHLVVAEAENNDGVTPRNGKTWSANSTAGFSGTGALQATPNTGVNNNTGYVTNSPRIDFKINFTQTGTHHVWIRGLAPTGSDDTVHVGLDGAAVATSDRINGFPDGVYTWSNTTADAVVATINVTTPGIHTLNVWMREDGFIVDKVLVTTNAAFVPTGAGPLESPRSANAPVAPTNLGASTASSTQVDLTWTDNSTNETGFKVYRKEGAGGTYTVIHTTAANAQAYSDMTAEPGKTYFYRVAAAGESDSTLSNEASASTPQVTPAAASGLTATNPTSSSITLNWTDNSGNESGFKILRKQGAGGTYATIFTTAANVTTFLDTNLDPETQYFYQVVTTNSAGDAAPSNEANATTESVASTPAFQQGAGPDHLVVAEAENNDGVLAQGGKTWSPNSTAGFSGSGALQSTPNTGINRNTGYTTQSPRIDFNINFTQTGTHYVWIRGFAPTSSDDTVHVGFNGAEVTSSDRMSGFPDGAWTWSNTTMDGPVATINVTTPGVHTLNVWMREDGFIADKVLLTTNAAFVPTGTGPAESPHSGDVAPAAASGLNITGTSSTLVNLAWADNSTNETGFKVFRKEGAAGTYALIHTTAADATSYADNSALPNTNYFYKVVATNAIGDSTDSNEVETTTPTLAQPAAPSGLDATPVSASSIGLTWNDNATNESSYRLERKIGAAGVWAAIQNLPANSTGYTDIDLDAETTYFYRVVAVNVVGEATSNEDSATTLAAPSGLNGSNINTPLAGQTTTVTEGNAYDTVGGGLDIYDVADSFHFANQARTGDFDVRVQIASFTAPDGKAKAGLMVRESLDAGSQNLFAGVTITDGYRFSRRSATNGLTTNVFKGNTVTFPNAWVRLRRQGNTFTAYRSTDGQSWTQMGQVTQALPATVFFGLATSSKSNSVTATAQYRNLDELPVAPAGNQINWVDGVDAPLAVQETLTAQVGNELFVMGGYMSGLIATRSAYKLNLSTNVWTQIADLPNAQTHVSVATDGTYIYAMGGQIGSGESTNITAEAWKYHIATNIWSPFTALPEARAGGAMVYHNGFLHFFGGVLNDRVTVSDKHWAIPVNESTGWVAKAAMINPGDHLSAHELNGKIYAIGGEHDHGFDYIQHNALSEYDPVADTWTSKAPLPVASSHFEGGTLVVHGRILLLGGQIDGQLQTDAVRSWDPLTNTWTIHSPLPLIRKGGSAAFFNDKVIYTAGRGKNVNGGPVYSDETWIGTFESPWWGQSLQALQVAGAGSSSDGPLLVPDDESWETEPGAWHEPACCCNGCLGAITMTYEAKAAFAQ